MTGIYDRRLGAWVCAPVLTLVMASLIVGAGCKKAPKNDGAQTSKMAPAKSKTMNASSPSQRSADIKKKTVAGPNSKIDTSAGMAGSMTNPGGMTATPPAPIRPRPAVGPVKVQLVVGLNATKLRKTFLWKRLLAISKVKTVLSGKTYRLLKKALGTDPLVNVDSVRFVLGGKSLQDIQKPEHLAVIVSGRFDASATLKKLVKAPLRALNGQLALTKIHGKDAIRGKGEGFTLVALNKNTLAMCSNSIVSLVINGDLSGGNAAIAVQLKGLDTKVLAWMVFGGVQVPLGGAGAPPALAALKKIRGGSVTLNAGKPHWKMVNTLDVGTPGAAKSLLQLVKMAKMAMANAGGRPGAPPGLVAILKNLSVFHKGRGIIATVQLPEADMKSLLDLLLKKL